MHADVPAFWSLSDDDLLATLSSGPAGLSDAEAARRAASAPPQLGIRRSPDLELFVRQFNSPILWLLMGAAVLSAGLGETTDAAIIAAILLASGILGFFQERGAERAVDALLASVAVTCEVIRDGIAKEIPLGEIVVGDVVELNAGDVVPGDGRILDANSMLVDESALTGEAYPRHKHPGVLPAETELVEQSNAVHLGTHVASGEGRMIVVQTGAATEFGQVSKHLATRHVPTSFERGITEFGTMLLKATAALVVGLFVVNLFVDRPFVDALLFSLALAIGLTPQMLPAIVTLSLSRGASMMAKQRVIVKRLDSIEDIGGLDVLCTDKTGTLTTGAVALDSALDAEGSPSTDVADLAWLNAHHQTGFGNPIDDAIRATVASPAEPGIRLGELPYDFDRKRLSVLVELSGGTEMVTKGAFDNVLECCTTIVGEPVAVAAEALRARFEQLSSAGFRVLGVARRAVAGDAPFTADDERGLDFAGFLTFSDPPKPGAREAIERLRALGVSVRLITGDNRLAARHIAGLMDLRLDGALVGSELATMDEDALIARVAETEVFAEVTPVDKERIVKALSLAGHTVGFLGDGINDTPALHVADVGISVDSAVDVAKQTADIVLLSKDLGVLGDGIEAGRSVFANTLKYVYVTTSANFGNMLSMAAAAAFLPFLPLLPTQILLLNFMSDIPGTTIATDRVDVEQLNRPRRWNVHQVRNFMIVFGLISTVFDLLTFATLRVGFSVSAVDFRSAWFIESTATELAVMLVLRTRRSCFRSRPSTALLISSALVLVATFALPYSPLAAPLGLDGPSPAVVAALLAIVVGYVVVTETLKHFLPMLFADEVIPSRP